MTTSEEFEKIMKTKYGRFASTHHDYEYEDMKALFTAGRESGARQEREAICTKIKGMWSCYSDDELVAAIESRGEKGEL